MKGNKTKYEVFNLRFTEKLQQLKKDLEQSARDNDRSLQSEIMFRLKNSFN